MGEWLTKAEVNAHYYNTVAGEIVFATEAQAGPHAEAVARAVSLHAKSLGRRRIRIVELGANNCAFARSLLLELRLLIDLGLAELDRVDYVAVEYARDSLTAAAAWEEEHGLHDRVLRPPGLRVSSGPGEPEKPSLVALLQTEGRPSFNVALVHAEANQFARTSEERFDVAILNELLDDMPYRAFYSDPAGRHFEAVALSRDGGSGWTVRVAAEEVADGNRALAGMPPSTLTARSAESVELVTRLSGLLDHGGLLLLHDYGFAETFTGLDKYEGLPPSVPPFVSMDFPPGSERGFPRCFFRVFGNERLRVVQVTNDVNFAELAAALEPTGRVTVLPHGNALWNRPGGEPPAKGDGVFLSEFGLLRSDDDLPALLADLHARQAELRDAYVREHLAGRGSVFLDLVYVRD